MSGFHDPFEVFAEVFGDGIFSNFFSAGPETNEAKIARVKVMPLPRYQASLIADGRRKQRTPEELDALLGAILRVLDESREQITIRHLFYRLVSLKALEKTEKDCEVLQYHLTKWRRAGLVEYSAFADSTRWYIRKPSYDGLHDALERTRDNYRRDMWAAQPYYVEVWVDKDAIAGVVSRIAESYGVPVFVYRGFSSLTGIYQASETFQEIKENGKQPVILHVGDYDPSGQVAADAIEKSLLTDFGCEGVEFHRIAVTADQVSELGLPTRPTKTSTHSGKWTGGDSVEIDAMSSEQIQGIVEAAIVELIDQHEWNALRKIETQERKTLAKITAGFRKKS
jgi:hypothetical protein